MFEFFCFVISVWILWANEKSAYWKWHNYNRQLLRFKTFLSFTMKSSLIWIINYETIGFNRNIYQILWSSFESLDRPLFSGVFDKKWHSLFFCNGNYNQFIDTFWINQNKLSHLFASEIILGCGDLSVLESEEPNHLGLSHFISFLSCYCSFGVVVSLC